MVQFGTVVLIHPVCIVRVWNQDVLQLQEILRRCHNGTGSQSSPLHVLDLNLDHQGTQRGCSQILCPISLWKLPHCRTWIPSNLFLQPSLQKGLRVQVLEPKTEDRTAVSVKTLYRHTYWNIIRTWGVCSCCARLAAASFSVDSNVWTGSEDVNTEGNDVTLGLHSGRSGR